jgi:2-polyprenyl-6-methoxyphenol hydroxylase-like FAD-dependent oxidoreductase
VSEGVARARLGEHAVVLGGGMAGLLAAHVLTAFFERVTLIERDRYPEQPGARKGVPQSHHVHLLLARGANELEAMFPGFGEELGKCGAPLIDFTADVVSRMPFGWLPRIHTGITVHGASRMLVEWLVRKRMAALGRVTFRESHRAIGLVAAAGGAWVTGVRLQAVGAAEESVASEARGDEFAADLVVDATGRGSRAPRWLKELGFGEVVEEVINPFLGYATQVFEPPPGDRDWKMMSTVPTFPDKRRGGTILSIEGGLWMALMVGINRDYPPSEDAGFLEFSRGLMTPLLHDALRDAKPVTPVHAYRGTENNRRRFDLMPRWPDGFIAFGDSVASLNPYYGQGMTVCAIGAATLQAELGLHAARSSKIDGFARRFHRRLAKLNELPWMMATGEDKRWPGSKGGTKGGAAEKVMLGYMNALATLIPERHDVASTFFHVVHMLKPPTALFRPSVLAPTVARAIRGGRGADINPTPPPRP